MTHLKTSPHYITNENTDYTVVAARIGILDIAIGPGFSSFAFLVPTPSHGERSQDLAKPNHNSDPSKAYLPSDESDTEPTFNAHIDSLTTALRALASRIRDAGAAHMRRTECKTAIERLVVRLEFAARTKPKPRRGVFGAASAGVGITGAWGAGGHGLEGVMERYLGLRKEGVGGGVETGGGAEVKG